MQNWLLLAVSMSFALFSGTLTKDFTARSGGNTFLRHLFMLVTRALCVVVFLVWGGLGHVSTFTLLLGVAFGLVTELQGVLSLRAYEIGPYSYSSVLFSLSTLIPTLSGAVFWNEPLNAFKIVGIVLMVVSFILSVERSDNRKNASVRWLVYCVLVMLLTGAIGVMQKVHQSSAYREELNGFLIVAFAVVTVCSAFSTVFFGAREKRKAAPAPEERTAPARPRLAAWYLAAAFVVCGVGIAVNNKLNLYLSGVMESAVFFPIVNGGGLVLAILAGVVVFRERLRPKQWVGVVCGIAAVLLLALF